MRKIKAKRQNKFELSFIEAILQRKVIVRLIRDKDDQSNPQQDAKGFTDKDC